MTQRLSVHHGLVGRFASVLLVVLFVGGLATQGPALHLSRDGVASAPSRLVPPVEQVSGPPAPGGYPFFFNETHLPTGTDWSVQVNGLNVSSHGNSSIEVHLLPAVTPVNVTPVPGFVPGSYHYSVDPTGPNQALNISWHAFLLNVSFDETGLPVGKTWAVNFSGNVNQTTGTIAGFEAPNGTYSFSVIAPAGYQSNITTGRLHLLNQGRIQRIKFSLILYNLTFEESGLPTGQAWSVEAGGVNETSTSTVISFNMPNGTLTYKVLPISGFHASIYSGNLDIAGVTITVSVNWTLVTYSLGFSESGLPNGTRWSVAILGGPTLNSSQPSLTMSLPNGTYSFALQDVPGFRGSPPSGVITLDGKSETLSFLFDPVTYNLTMSEEGLPAGVLWGVSMNGTDWVSHASTLNLSVGNGSWSWRLQQVPGFRGQPSAGTIRVQGVPETVLIHFQLVTYRVVAEEHGLPQGKTWEITVTGNIYISQNAILSFSLPNGTYLIEVGPVAGYVGTAVPSTALSVNGAPSVISVVYNLTTDPAGHPGSDLFSSWQSISVLLFLVILALILIAFLFRRHHSRGRR